MRTAPKPFITAHRLARLNAWARLWLMWVVGVWAAWWTRGGRADARALDPLARRVGTMIMINAAARFRPPQRSRHRHGRLQPVRLRTILGARLRRAMRGKDVPHRLVAILTLMRDLDRAVARLLKRLPRGLTRLRVLLPAPTQAPLIAAAPSIAPACADTS
jgi:hypothetical protein